MTGKISRFAKLKIYDKKRILVLSSILISFILLPSLKYLDINANLESEDQKYIKNEDFQIKNLETQDLTSDNTFTDKGSAWNVTHYAYQTKTNLEVRLNNNSYNADQQIKLDTDWMGYQLNSTIKNLYIIRNLVNGTFHSGSDNGYTKGDDDSNQVLNWTFGELDGAQSNTMEGNYYDGVGDGTNGADCLELRIHEDSFGYDTGDKCWWISDFTIPQEEIEEASIYLAINPKYADQDAGHFTFRIKVNDITVMSRNLYSLYDVSGNEWSDEEERIDNLEEVFPIGFNNANITLEFERTGGSYGGYGIPSYGVLIDNVSLVVKAKAKPNELELKLNNIQINDDPVNNGEGYLKILGSWDGSTQSSVIANFSSNLNWPLVFIDDGSLRSYKIELETNLTLYINKSTPESYYTADPDLNYQGSAFIVSNNSNVNWTTYAHMEIPAGYEETNLTVEYPSDYSLTGVFFSQNPNSLSETSIKKYGNKKIVNIPVSSITSNTNGFWKLTAVSPNYCKEISMYNNATGDWELNNEFLSGEYINITGKVNNSQLISGYIQQTKAQLQIRFPNGTIWSAQNQIKPVDDTGMVFFDPIMIPDDVPNYETGLYEAIITWNNSHSFFSSNETGVIYKKFIVIHESVLYPDQGIFFIENILDDRIINIKVSFSDLIDGTAIDYALVYTDFTGTIETFDRISPGFYLYEFNATKANAGNNTITVYANSTYYSNKIINITVEVIKQTILNVITDFFTVPWKQNFTVQFSYTEKNNPLIGIDTTDITIDEWLGDYHLTQPSVGQYELECNTSAYAALTLQSFVISINPYKYEPQSVLIRVSITELTSSLTLFLDSVPKKDKDTIQVQADEFINVTVFYQDNITKQYLRGANVTLLGKGIDLDLTEINNQYNVTVDTDDLNPGITVLTVFAQLDNYQSESIQFFVEIVERETELLLFLDGTPKNDGDQIQVEVNEFINVTVFYRDNLTKQFLNGASVTLIGRGSLTETGNHYNITVDTNDLDQGITVLTLFAQLDNYQPQSIQFFVEVVERESKLELYLDGDPCFDPVIEATIGDILNITVYYTDNQTGSPISGALVQLIGEGLTINFTENVNKYSIYLNVTELKIGVSLFTIVAHANNFQIRTIDLRITTNRIKITPSTDTRQPYITGLEGDTIKLIIILNNTNMLPFGELIKNATVTYKWAYGQGLLLDPDNDGIYEADLVNVPSGTYIITITASAGDDYDFESYEITLSVNIREGLDLTLLVIIFSSIIIGLLLVFGLYQKHFKYPPLVRKIRKLRKKVRKGKKIKPIGLSKREEIVKETFNNKINQIELKTVKSEKGFKEQVDSKIEKSDNLQNGGN
ncbi:MAG: hypothetical protein ACFFDL_14415 [Promethearchaeota archaeon]